MSAPPSHAVAQLSSIERIRADFVAHVAAGLEEYQVIETVARKADRQAALRKGLGVDVFAQAMDWDTRDFLVVDMSRKTKAHLGVLRVRYADSAPAQKQAMALQRLNGVFAGSEILTRFVSVSEGEDLLLLYTETALNDRVMSFLRARGGQVP
jgi:hypothetical protein